jgi:hypothetical protein
MRYVMKMYEEVDLQTQVFLTSGLLGSEQLVSRPHSFTLGQMVPGSHWIKGWVGPKSVLDNKEER